MDEKQNNLWRVRDLSSMRYAEGQNGFDQPDMFDQMEETEDAEYAEDAYSADNMDNRIAAMTETETGEPVVKRGRGRPKGTTKAKKMAELAEQERRRNEEELARNPTRKTGKTTYNSSDMQHTLGAINMFREIAERDGKVTAGNGLLYDRYTKFMNKCQEIGFKPTLESLCVCCGITRQNFYNWKMGLKGGPEVQEIAQLISESLAAVDADLAMNNKVYPATYIFRAKNYHGLKDETEVVVTPNNPLGDAIPMEELEKKYEYLPED